MKVFLLKLRTILLFDALYLVLFILVLGYALVVINFFQQKSVYQGNETCFKGRVIKYKINGNLLALEFHSKEKLKVNYILLSETEKNHYSKEIKYDTNLLICGDLAIPENNTIPNTFNYKNYLENNRIYWILNASKVEVIKQTDNIFYKIKNNIGELINKRSSKTYLNTFILANKDFLDAEITNSYQKNGISHLFAVSGMHIGFFSMVIYKLLRKLRLSENKSLITTVIFNLFFVFLCGFTPSALRAFTLYALITLNKLFQTEVKLKNIALLSGSILIFLNPYIILDIGFQFSFIISFCLISSAFDNKDKLKTAFKTSIISFMASVPILAYNFYEINFLSILINIIYIPFTSCFVFPLAILTIFIPVFDNLLNMLIYFLETSSLLVADINFFKVVIPKCSLFFCIVYYVLLYLFFRKNQKRYLLPITILFLVQILKPNFDRNLYVYILDVGQGDAIVIRTPYNKKLIMVDTGGSITYQTDAWKERSKKYQVSDNIITFIKSLGRNTIDELFITHGDFDHMGESINIVNNLQVDKVIFNNDSFNDLELELIKVLDSKNIQYYKNVEKLNAKNNMIYFLNNKLYDNENDNSNVLYFNYNNLKMLFMGDAGIRVEEDILNKYNLKNIDILKVAHHGSKTSSSKNFIDILKPKYSVISVGKNNRYGHPNKEVLNNLKDTKVYRTDKNGSIMFKIKKNRLEINTCVP